MRHPWTRLRWQLMLTYLPLILTPLLLTGLVTRGVTEQGLTLLVSERAQERALQLAQQFSQYYVQHGTWDGASVLMFTAPPPLLILPLLLQQGHPEFDPQQVLITDTNGVIIASDRQDGLGQALSADALEKGAPIYENGKQIATLVIGAALGILDARQRQILDEINGALVVSGVVSASLAAILGLGLSWQITRPVKQLMGGVKRLGRGEWSEPLAVIAHNEFGDLTHAFNGMAAEVTHQQQLRRQMVADVAHDLRTPLSAMLLEIEAIEAGMQSPQQAAASLREEITWLQHLVNDLRVLSLMDAGQMTLQAEPTLLQPFLESVYDFWLPLVEDSGSTLCLDAPPTLPAAQLDKTRMRQMLGNLLDNAVQHTPPNGHITLGGCVEAEGTVQIYVMDDGRGIDPEDLPRIFDRFYRTDPARQENSAHSGLGLSIAQRLAELHRGTIDVQSAPGQGATFRVRLPASPSK